MLAALAGNHDVGKGKLAGNHVDCGGVGLKGMQGVATREDIDKTLKLGMNHPMGPLQLGASSVLSLRISKH